MADKIFTAILRNETTGVRKKIMVRAVNIEEAATNIDTTPKGYECISLTLQDWKEKGKKQLGKASDSF